VDSLSQLALGAGIGVAVMGRRTGVWKAALWGGVCGTLPDLDALIDHGDPVRNMTFHRAESHSLFFLTLLSPAIAAGVAKLHGEMDRFRRWWLALWLALVTHPLLDNMTIYGTQLLQPFTDHPFWIGSIFIIDPLYTLPLLIGLLATAIARGPRRWRWNAAGLALSTLYLGWSMVAQQHVRGIAERALLAQGLEVERMLVTPTPFNTVLWRVLAMDADGRGYHEAFYSLADGGRLPRFDRFERDPALYAALASDWAVARMSWFSHGFYRMREVNGRALIVDLRMGQEPGYVFEFAVAARGSPWHAIRPVAVGSRGDTRAGLAWLWRRLNGDALPPPRGPVATQTQETLP
jgi:inner membrane protein